MPPRTTGLSAAATSSSSSSTLLQLETRKRRRQTFRKYASESPYWNRGNLCLGILVLLAMTTTVVMNVRFYHHHHPRVRKEDPSSSTAVRGHQLVKKSKKGQVMHRVISNVNVQDLKDLTDDAFRVEEQHGGSGSSANQTITWEEAIRGREEIVQRLREAGVTEMDVETLLLLPKWETVVKLYGSEPVIHGLDQCEYYRRNIPRNDASMGVAGIFNSGTNLLAMYLSNNCRMPDNPQRNHGMRWQVPWGKHILASYKWNNTAKNDERQNKTNVLPVVLVRDPYSWMNSMCGHPYSAKWHHSPKHCPNLVPNQHDYAIYPFAGHNIPVRIRFSKEKNIVHKWDSLAHVWTGWNRLYYDANYPRLMVRFEDIIFHPRQLTERVCACGGAVPLGPSDSFIYMVDSAKWGPGHGRQAKTSLISAMIKYGNAKRRLEHFTQEDLELAHEALDQEMMKTFHFHMPLADPQQLVQ